jgi:uncharacterized membrane-anchored protein YhcB (DUF1043 family)
MDGMTIVVVTAVVQCAIGFLFWLLLQRNVEKFDRLQEKLKRLEETRVQALEENMAEHVKQNTEARMALMTELRELDRVMVTRAECEKLHAQTEKRHSDNAQKVYDASLKLEALATQTTRTVGWLGEQQNALIVVKEDVAGLIARVEDLKGRR